MIAFDDDFRPLTPAWTRLVAHPTRVAAIVCRKRFIGLACGRGSGKTEIAKRRLVAELRLRKAHGMPAAYFYAAPTQEQAERIAWRDLLSLIPRAWIKPGGIHISKSRIETIFNSSVAIVGLDKPERIEGPQWDGCVIDESCDIRPGAFDLSVIPALSWRNGWAMRIGVPKRRGVGAAEFRKWFEGGQAGKYADRACFTWSSEDILDQIDPQKLAYARDNLDAKDYNEQFRARWENAGGTIFDVFDRTVNVRPCGYRPELPIFIGCDFNVDPMAWVLAHHFPQSRTIEVFDELFMRDTNTRRTIEKLLARYGSHTAGFRFFIDAAGGQRRTSAAAVDETDYRTIENDARLRALNSAVLFPRRKAGKLEANPPREGRFAATNAKLLNANGVATLFVDDRCTHLIADLENRFYKDGTREPADRDDLGHASDALGYLVHALYPHSLVINRIASPVIMIPE